MKTNKPKKTKSPIDAEFVSRRKSWPKLMNMQLSLESYGHVQGSMMLHLRVATVNGADASSYPSEFIASLMLSRESLLQLCECLEMSPKQAAELVSAQIVLDRARQLALAAQEASVVAQSAALAVGAAARRVHLSLGGKD